MCLVADGKEHIGGPVSSCMYWILRVAVALKWRRGTPEQRFRAASGCGARPSSDFERKARPVRYFRMLLSGLRFFQAPNRPEDLLYNFLVINGIVRFTAEINRLINGMNQFVD